MKKKLRMLAGAICYGIGVVSCIYIGGWLMLLKPIQMVLTAFRLGTLNSHLLVASLIKIALSLTVGGFLWCLGYAGYNYFRGTEDPDWDAINARIEAERQGREELVP